MRGIEYGRVRTECECATCRAFCEFMPSFLSPLDLERYLSDIPENEVLRFELAESNLLASPDAVAMRNGVTIAIPTLVPATKPDGSCIHLTPDRRCAIHGEAPFGCAYFDCNSGPGGSGEVLFAIYQEWLDAGRSWYARIWLHLHAKQLLQKNPVVLREKMAERLSTIDSGDNQECGSR